MRLEQFAKTRTHPENGRFSRTLATVSGSVAGPCVSSTPVDIMANRPWSEEPARLPGGPYLVDHKSDTEELAEQIVSRAAPDQSRPGRAGQGAGRRGFHVSRTGSTRGFVGQLSNFSTPSG